MPVGAIGDANTTITPITATSTIVATSTITATTTTTVASDANVDASIVAISAAGAVTVDATTGAAADAAVHTAKDDCAPRVVRGPVVHGIDARVSASAHVPPL